jgi:hypothetical protein
MPVAMQVLFCPNSFQARLFVRNFQTIRYRLCFFSLIDLSLRAEGIRRLYTDLITASFDSWPVSNLSLYFGKEASRHLFHF